MNNIALVIPIYNEQEYIGDFLKSLSNYLQTLPHISHVILVDDGSTDKTPHILKMFQKKHSYATIIQNAVNSGKGYAMRKGLYEAARLHCNGVIFMDGDGQHDPIYLPQFISSLKIHPVVFGYRELDMHMPYIRRWGNNIAYFIIHHLFRIHRYGDILCGYFAMRHDMFDIIRWKSDDYGVEAEISAIVGRRNITFSEVKVSTIYLDRRKGVNLWHAVQILLRIPLWNIIHRP